MFRIGQNVDSRIVRASPKAELVRLTVFGEAQAEDFALIEIEETEGLCFAILGEPYCVSFGVGFGEFDLWDEQKIAWHALVRYRSARDQLIKENGGENTNWH